MSMLKSIEGKLEGLVEGFFGRTFKASVQPVELAHKLAKEMGDHKTVGVSNVYVPNEFDVYLGKDDFEHLASFEDSLKQELSNYVTAFARREGWTLVAPPRIELNKDDDLRVGEFGIATRTVMAPPREAEDDLEAPPVARPATPPVAPAVAPALSQTVLYDRPPAAAPAPAPAVARYVLRGPGVDAELTEGIMVVGRSRRCDVVLTDPNVSRQHAELRLRNGVVAVRDLDSTNGTRVNGRTIREATVHAGDRIELGTSLLRLERLE